MEQRVKRLEESMDNLSSVLYEMKGTLESIRTNIISAIGSKDRVITIEEKIKVTENRLLKLERNVDEIKDNINNINLKIAGAMGGGVVIGFLIQKIL